MEENGEEEMTNYDFSECYIHLKIKTDPAILRLVEELKPRTNELYDKSRLTNGFKTTELQIQEYNMALVNVIENLNKEYQNKFGKDRQKSDKMKVNITQTFTLQK